MFRGGGLSVSHLMLHQMRRLGRPQSFRGTGPVALLASIGAAMTLVPVASSAATRPPSLSRPTKYALGRIPTQVATGDLTGDGKPELVIGALGAVSVLV